MIRYHIISKGRSNIMKSLLTTFILVLSLPMVTTSPAYASASHKKICAVKVNVYTARCYAQAKSHGSKPLATQTFKDGYGPEDFRTAYGGSADGAMHIAVVVAYDAPNAQKDLGVYSAKFNLPTLPACSKNEQVSCFVKLDQQGGTNYPAVDASWALEASMDIQSAHGACPKCRISLVEANSPGYQDLSMAVDVAVSVGAKIISNSYGGAESPQQRTYDSHYKHDGVIMVASSGDSGYGTSWPAASPDVIAVGGTTLQMHAGKVTSETAWEGSGSGCSKYELKPSWQRDTLCQRRSIADVAAVATACDGGGFV